MTDRADIDGWPSVLRTIAEDERLGRDTALRLSRAFGGTYIFVARNPSARSPVLREIGRTKCAALYDLFGSDRIMIPMGPLTSDRARRDAIARLLKAGRSHSFIARQVKVHLETVKRHARRTRDDRQIDLFSDHR